ncbi:hybrid sensor histidine kinase/response regulator transcription factor [Sphingobacterium corticibacterium]|uniref:histidine kinase n=1 Tax=Sphingobacterium corticibacterium TaxID=2484746 RepID=A0A4Q6XTZ2_9SPHI|nr:hybrid sensor histidine kinase/response regulator transcription factor [Sphingobacterium corticibacterium]RZF60289.1 hybrid sensor histidine kinase/response regulator [Sphingobacterium corticibacterium]
MNIYLFCFTLFWGTFLQAVHAQKLKNIPDDLKFQHFTSVNGLSQRSVADIIQDKKGFIWFGTRDGLNKFDGQKFVVYRHNTTDSASLSNSNIHAIYEDQGGNLWVGTERGLNKYNPATDKFIRYTFADSPHAVADNLVHDITQLSSRILWVATENGIIQLDIQTNEIKKIQKQAGKPHSLSDNNLRSFLRDGDGNIWICNTRYIDVYNIQQGQFKRLEYPQKANKSSIHLNDLPSLYLDKKNTLWLGYEQGLARYDRSTESFVDFEFKQSKAITSATRTICEDHAGNLWIGSYSGLYILSADRQELKHIVHDPDNSGSLSQNSIYRIIRDSRGDMWIGTWADGINYYNRDNTVFKNIHAGNTANKLNYKVVSGMAEDASGNLWIGTEGGGLNYYNRNTQKFTYYTHRANDPHSISANNIKSVIIGRDSNIWIGMHDGGLDLLTASEKPFKFQKIDFPPNQNISLKAYKVLTLFEDHNGNIWIGTLTGGLIFYDTDRKILSKIDKDIKTVMSITQTENPDLLLIGGNNGIETIHIHTKQKQRVQVKEHAQTEPLLYVNTIFVDPSGHYWIGTEGQGLYIYNPKEQTTKSYSKKDGLPNDIIYGILPDDNGKIWVSTNNGISQIDPASNTLKNYNQSDGLQGNEFNYGSFFKTGKNELFFGGTNGLSYFDPKDLRRNTFVPPIDITNIDVNNALFRKITDSVTTIILAYNENNFSIDFTSLSYMRPEKNEFAYRLEGYDEDWNYIGNQRRAVYTNIQQGEYVFKVIGANNDGIWNERGTTLRIHVLPPPWKTWWAYLLYFILCSSLFLYIRKLTLLRIKERKEKERAEEINQLKLQLFTDISHDFRTPLTLIISPLEKMVHKKLGDSYIQRQHDIMLKNARMLLQLVNQILDFRKSESGKLTLQATKNNIVPFIEEVKSSFDALADKKNIQYRFITRHDHIPVWFDKAKLKNMLFNLLSNAFKFSHDDSDITIYVSTTSKKVNGKLVNYVKISVLNFGPVISKEDLPLIFEQFYQLPYKQKNLGSGIGLSLTKRLVELHRGKIIVNSSETKGTRFSILLKLGNEHLEKNECIEESAIFERYEEDLQYVDVGEDQFDLQQEIGIDAEPSSDTHFVESRQNLLIVEDNIDLQKFIQEIFKDKYRVFTAENGEDAIAIAHQETIDLIVSDVQMPIMDGFELCRYIKTTLICSHIPVILLTAKTSSVHQEKGYRTGADAYITKPFNAEILALRVDNLLKTRANLVRKFKQDTILEPKKLTISSPDELFLEKAISVVEHHISDPDFNVSAFIEQMNMSRTVIYTKLKALTGQNLSTFIRLIRLKKASTLITHTPMNVSQVAYEVGFNDLKYFRESFKELYKVTPSEYKKQYQEKKHQA